MPRERQLFVAGLASGTTQEDLLGMFGKFGEVESSSVTTDSKGKTIGFVTYENNTHARKAETTLHGKMVNNAGPLVVVPALSRSEKNDAAAAPKQASQQHNQHNQAHDPSILTKLQVAVMESAGGAPQGAGGKGQRGAAAQPQQGKGGKAAGNKKGGIVDKLVAAGMSNADVSKWTDDKKPKNIHDLAAQYPQHVANEGGGKGGKKKHQNQGQHQHQHHHQHHQMPQPQAAPMNADAKRILELELEIARLKTATAATASSLPMDGTIVPTGGNNLLGGFGGGAPGFPPHQPPHQQQPQRQLQGRQGPNQGQGQQFSHGKQQGQPVTPQQPHLAAAQSSLLGNLGSGLGGIQSEDFQKHYQALNLQNQLLAAGMLPPTTPQQPVLPNPLAGQNVHPEALQQAYALLSAQHQLALMNQQQS